MDNPTTIISQNIINVDIDSRAVTLPVNFNLGVMYDNSCKNITFMVQQKSDITDLTDLTFSINTISAKGTPDKLDCTCREEGGFYIITALLKGTIFEASGKAVFNLCGQKFDSSHVAVKSWGSEDITALVGSHSHADKAIEELYPSVLEELRQKVNNPNLTDEQLNNIATKVAEKGFYTKTEIDSMIADIVVPTRLSQLADDTEHRTVTDAEKEKWNKPSITVDTELSDTSENPVTNKAITEGIISYIQNLFNAFDELLKNNALVKYWEEVGKSASVVDKHVIEAPERKEYTNIIIIGEGLKANGDTKIQCGVSYLGNNYTIINGIDTTFNRDTSINYFAELEVIPGVGVKATIRSGTKPLLECEQCYSVFVDVDTSGIRYVSIDTQTSGVSFTSGKFTVYGR